MPRRPAGRVYHVTYARALPSIASRGLVQGHPQALGRSHVVHAARGVFFTAAEGLSFWMARAEGWAGQRSDRPLTDGLVPVVLRTPRPPGLRPDPLGTEDAGAPAWIGPPVPPEALELWDGSRWQPPSAWGRLDPSLAFELEEDPDGGGTLQWFRSDSPLAPRGEALEEAPSPSRRPNPPTLDCDPLCVRRVQALAEAGYGHEAVQLFGGDPAIAGAWVRDWASYGTSLGGLALRVAMTRAGVADPAALALDLERFGPSHGDVEGTLDRWLRHVGREMGRAFPLADAVATARGLAAASRALHPEPELVVYRGVGPHQAAKIRGGADHAEGSALTSWSERLTVAARHADPAKLENDGRPGAVIRLRVPRSALALSHRLGSVYLRQQHEDELVLALGPRIPLSPRTLLPWSRDLAFED